MVCSRCQENIDSNLKTCPYCGDEISTGIGKVSIDQKLARIYVKLASIVAPVSSYLTFIMIAGFILMFILTFSDGYGLKAEIIIWIGFIWLWCSAFGMIYHIYYPTRTELVGDEFKKTSVYERSRNFPLTQGNSIFYTAFFFILTLMTVWLLIITVWNWINC